MTPAGTSKTDIRNTWVSWRIICEVIKEASGRKGRCRERLQITKQIDLWRLYSNGVRRRNRRWNIPIRPQIRGNVEVNNGRIIFEDGYILFVDQPLSDQIMDLANIDWDPVAESESYFGEIVNVTAEINLPPPGKDLNTYPLFYYPQMSEKYLALSIISENGSQKIDWRLFDEDKNNFIGETSDRRYFIPGPEGWHKVTVRQVDLKLSTEEHEQRFDYLVDGMPLHQLNLDPTNFNFQYNTTRGKLCYIGRAPDPSNDKDWHTLTGELRYLIFDPNDSCPTCRG